MSFLTYSFNCLLSLLIASIVVLHPESSLFFAEIVCRWLWHFCLSWSHDKVRSLTWSPDTCSDFAWDFSWLLALTSFSMSSWSYWLWDSIYSFLIWMSLSSWHCTCLLTRSMHSVLDHLSTLSLTSQGTFALSWSICVLRYCYAIIFLTSLFWIAIALSSTSVLMLRICFF